MIFNKIATFIINQYPLKFMDWDKIKKSLKKFWHFLWKEDSLLSWIVNIAIAFVLIKFIIYPGLGLLLGTNLPVVAVISESMDHGMTSKCTKTDALMNKCIEKKYDLCERYFNNRESVDFDKYWSLCGSWYENISLSKEEFLTYPFNNGFSKGDIIVLRGTNYENLQIGEVIVFQSKMNYPIIHRVIKKNDFIETKGDHNAAQIQNSQLNEKYINKDQLIGRAWIKIPFLGYIKIWFTDLLRCVTLNGCKFS